MSHEGSSYRPYIKRPTEKDRLDNFAFSSFPEDYLPYTSLHHHPHHHHHHHRAVPAKPPYLIWDNEIHRPRKRSCSSTKVLVLTISVIVAAILGIVAVAVYLGVETNLFRSPVLSLFGTFRVSAGDSFTETLLNSSSSQFLNKAETYQNLVENVISSSSLKQSFISAKIYSFKPGMLVFFRLYLDRRKLTLDDSEVKNMIRDILRSGPPLSSPLTIDKNSVRIEDVDAAVPMQPALKTSSSTNDYIIKMDSGFRTRLIPTNSRNPSTKKPHSNTGTGTVKEIGPVVPEAGTKHYGQWKPVPIDDMVLPAMVGDKRPPGSHGGSPALGVPSVRVLSDPMSHVDPHLLAPPPGFRSTTSKSPRHNEQVVSLGVNVGAGSSDPHPKRGDIASTITSSVSLTVRNKDNATTSNVKPLKDSIHVNRDHSASYRFLGKIDGNEDATKTEASANNKSDFSSGSQQETVRINSGSDIRHHKAEVLPHTTIKIDLSEFTKTTANVKDRDAMQFSTTSGDMSHLGRTDLLDDSVKILDHDRIKISDDSAGVLKHEVVEPEKSDEVIENGPAEYLDMSDESRHDSIEYPDVSEDFHYTSGDSLPVNADEVEAMKEDVKSEVPSGHLAIVFDKSFVEYADMQSTTTIPSREELNGPTFSTIIPPLNTDKSSHFAPEKEANFDNHDLGPINVSNVVSSVMYADSVLSADKSIDYIVPNEGLFETEPSATTITSVVIDNRETTEIDPDATNDQGTIDGNTQTEKITTGSVEAEDKDVHNTHTPDSGPTTFMFAGTTDTDSMRSFADSADSLNPGTHSVADVNDFSSEMKDDQLTTPLFSSLLLDDIFSLNSSVSKVNGHAFHLHTSNGHGFHSPVSPLEKNGHDTPTTTKFEVSIVDVSKDSDSNMSEAMHSLVPNVTTSEISIQDEVTPNTLDFSTLSAIFELLHNETAVDIQHTAITVPADYFSELELNDSSVAKIVPHIQDLGPEANDIDVNDDLPSDDIDDLHNDQDLGIDLVTEVIRHITLPPNVSVETIAPKDCSAGEVPCKSGECIDENDMCNMKRDCADNSDENQCSCADHLKAMGQSQKLCDGIEDCWDYTDELNCDWCTPGQVICPQTKFCIDRHQVCDGHADCPFGTDERHCVKLAASIADAESNQYRPDGFLMVQRAGTWGKLCLDHLAESEALQTRLRELGQAVCSTLTYRSMIEAKRIQDFEVGTKNYYVIGGSVPEEEKQSSNIFEPSTCSKKEVMKVQCDFLECGIRPMVSGSRKRIVGGQSSTNGAWPWKVALYKEGEFQCGAIILSDIWLVSAAHCFYSNSDPLVNHWTARLGFLRRGSELSNPWEELRQVNKIIIHPEYVDKGFRNDIALLRMDSPVSFSDYIRPVCLPKLEEDASLWHGRMCSVVGWGKLHEIGHTFPDSLQEVRLPVISTEECQKRLLFIPTYRVTENMFCAGYERGGRDACLGDSGGGLMCQRDDGRWILLGVTSNGDGCGRPNRPGVYTKVTQYLPWLREAMKTSHTLAAIAHTPDVCKSMRCRLGRCVPEHRVCDGKWDCAEGTDEENCRELPRLHH